MTGEQTGRPLALLVLAGGLALSMMLGACGSDPVDPATVRRERVETRLRSTYSAAQARCVLDRLDASTIAALDKSKDLPPSSTPLQRYSAAVRACVVPDATPASPPPATTTSGP